MLAMLWFWGAAVRVFERRRIRYDVCFSSEEQRYLLRSSQLFQASRCPRPAPNVFVRWLGCPVRFRLGSWGRGRPGGAT
jgi:hypothetical protein